MKVTVDSVVFSFFDNKLHVLLIDRALEPFKGVLALPGGYVGEDETTEQAVLRKLKEETNVSLSYLEQLYTFSDVERDPRGRTISVSYYGLIDASKHNLESNIHADKVIWYPIEPYVDKYSDTGTSIDSLIMAFDHKGIVKYALERLRNKLKYAPIGFELLPTYFSISELHSLYECILDKKIDRRNFTKKLNSYDLLIKTEFKSKGHVGRSANLYMFNESRYKELEKTGFNFEL